jgi:hypothetical protein
VPTALDRVAPGKPFERDISIWGESGGYTFRHAGDHRLFCTLRIGGTVLPRTSSNREGGDAGSTRQRLEEVLTQRSF